jgi:hypothetical protein
MYIWWMSRIQLTKIQSTLTCYSESSATCLMLLFFEGRQKLCRNFIRRKICTKEKRKKKESYHHDYTQLLQKQRATGVNYVAFRECTWLWVANSYCWTSSLMRYATSSTNLDSWLKVLLFLSFHMFHQKYMKNPSKVGLDFLSTFDLHFFHHPQTDWVESLAGRFCNLYHVDNCDQTALVNGQSLHRW